MPNANMRLSVPETFSSPLTKSSYPRLGSYSDEEAKLVTGLTATVNDDPAVTREHGADWREVAKIVLRVDAGREPDRAKQAYGSHLGRPVNERAWLPSILRSDGRSLN
ncbi:hypothetical protein NLM33_37615 [Bradyrhizobium sp. CCGUVB1N3]|uniref:hypothetical protein n=1 Tax=Bradyrhizobium sp. CCGUVB1N3 TaxID=2949629 RepID=UPI0020B4352C|nr:hypothetical protein [Bradyrhizobium sp. CCGUVB1N3]MCP3475958.1 hypothetical protein [Bradyrhizobium sp. CCGUVB1N3]